MLTKLAAVPLAASLTLFTITGWAQVNNADSGDHHSLEADHFLQIAEPEPQVMAPLAPASAAEFAVSAEPQSAATVVAEPGTWALLGFGILGLSLARRRLAHSAQQHASESKQGQ